MAARTHTGAASAEGWTIVLERKTRTRTMSEQYLPCTWATHRAATQALADLLQPYPPDSPWRVKLVVVRWPQSQSKQHPSEARKITLGKKRQA